MSFSSPVYLLPRIMEFAGPALNVDIPNLTVPQFILDSPHELRPPRKEDVPLFIEDGTGRTLCHAEVHHRTQGLANALSLRWSLSEDDVALTTFIIPSLFGPSIGPANPSYTVDELIHQLQTANANAIIVYSTFLPTIIEAARAVGIPKDRIILIDGPSNSTHVSVENLIEYGNSKPMNFIERKLNPGESKTKLAFLSFSSGTTGKKGQGDTDSFHHAVEIPHRSIISNVLQSAAHISGERDPLKRMMPGDVSLGVLPFFRIDIYGLIVTLHYALFSGFSVVVIPKFSFRGFLQSIDRYRITHLFVVPPQVVLLCKYPAIRDHDFSHVKFLMCGAAPLSGDLYVQLAKVFPNAMIGQGYGLTETATSVVAMDPTKLHGTIGAAGQLLPGIVAHVLKEDGSLAREGEQGELIVTGPSMALRYRNNEEATKSTFVNGWVRTGDEVIIRNNELFVVDRLKVRGFQVAPAELEGHLLLHPSVTDCCVVPVPNDYSGELPLAYVVLEPELRKRIGHVSDSKVQYKWLAGGVEFIDAIPKNPSGKILRRLLREQARKRKSAEVQAKL
ncbi:amp dependent CoA ligase [Guyanagaster necrorhizus]|uniref:Amp dependent CoA ligase n=1 Tax=Guyanagaster necrorhizus TaxID=856835 RepID=A0A9P7W599_9AGAR|nr:amp dependent CoA ligase [Guyanagaster necrorhizus MCA 3950]KAG7452393.1 amp dependent CoA ligase [Guyanagaster necrorhizus MCA 3950]